MRLISGFKRKEFVEGRRFAAAAPERFEARMGLLRP
jgi:hypothetical protein